VPAVFVLLSEAVTPHGRTVIVVPEGGRQVPRPFDPAEIHAGTMAPIATASLAALVGLFIVLDARTADQRLALAGQRRWVLVVSRLVTVTAAAIVAAAASLAVTALVFAPQQWPAYVAANASLALTYAFVGVLMGPLLGRVSGVFMAFLLPFLDLGIAQSPMLRGEPAGWAEWLPGYGGVRVMIDGALTTGFDTSGPLVLAGAWVLVLGTAAVALLLRTVRMAR
jgi:hypothetical protein